MARALEIASIILFAAGAIGICYIEAHIISKTGPAKSLKSSLLNTYWNDLSRKERWIFWPAFISLISPLILAVIK